MKVLMRERGIKALKIAAAILVAYLVIFIVIWVIYGFGEAVVSIVIATISLFLISVFGLAIREKVIARRRPYYGSGHSNCHYDYVDRPQEYIEDYEDHYEDNEKEYVVESESIQVRKEVNKMPKKVRCWKCGGSGRVERRLMKIQRGAPGIPQTQRCDVCNGKGWVWED